MPRLNCLTCGGEGRLYTSRYGGNDPDVWDAGQCPVCEGTTNRRCEAPCCQEDAIGVDTYGEALCQEHLMKSPLENAEGF